MKHAHNNGKNYFDTDIPKKSFEIGPKTPKIYREMCKTYKNSKKPAKRQFDRHGCFLKTTGNLICISLT